MWYAALASLDAAVYGTFSVPGVYSPANKGAPIQIDVILEHNVELIGEFGQVSEPVTTMMVSKSQLQGVKRDDTITAEGASYTVVRPVSDDGRDLRFVVTP